jgi:hypothetical protein
VVNIEGAEVLYHGELSYSFDFRQKHITGSRFASTSVVTRCHSAKPAKHAPTHLSAILYNPGAFYSDLANPITGLRCNSTSANIILYRFVRIIPNFLIIDRSHRPAETRSGHLTYI